MEKLECSPNSTVGDSRYLAIIDYADQVARIIKMEVIHERYRD